MGYFDPAMPYSADEMRRWGLAFDYERMAKPYITGEIIEGVFNEKASEIIEKYLQKRNNAHLLELKEPFNTQRKISDHFEPFPIRKKTISSATA
jgi:4-alpha-glucanotransferase